MDAFTNQQKLAAIILPMNTGFVSTCASGTIIYSIMRSRVKLKVPYRRLIFGLSCFDFIASVSFALSTLPMPSESGLIPELALGTESTCTAQGFFFIFGFLGSVLYSCSLSIYYFCTLKLNMPFTRFRKNCEVYLHVLSIGWALVACIICLADDSFNATPTHCTVTSFPQECIEDNEIECIKGKRSYFYQWALIAGPSFAVFLTIVYVMISIVCMHSQQENVNRTYNSISTNLNPPEEGLLKKAIGKVKSILRCTSPNEVLAREPGPLEANMLRRASRAENASRRREREVKTQAYLYIFAFFIGQIFFFVAAIMNQQKGNASFEFIILRDFFYPLQGLINIFVYTYPHVNSLRRSNSDYSWLSAFLSTILSGGDHDQLASWRQMRRVSRTGRRRGTGNRFLQILRSKIYAAKSFFSRAFSPDRSCHEVSQTNNDSGNAGELNNVDVVNHGTVSCEDSEKPSRTSAVRFSDIVSHTNNDSGNAGELNDVDEVNHRTFSCEDNEKPFRTSAVRFGDVEESNCHYYPASGDSPKDDIREEIHENVLVIEGGDEREDFLPFSPEQIDTDIAEEHITEIQPTPRPCFSEIKD